MQVGRFVSVGLVVAALGLVSGAGAQDLGGRDRGHDDGGRGFGVGVGVGLGLGLIEGASRPQAPVKNPPLPRKRKRTAGIIDVCEMQWVGAGTAECVQGSSKRCKVCAMHNGDAVISQPALIPNDSSRNGYWCGC